MYHPTTRVLTVLELLQSHGRMTGAELARRLEVHIRTVRHYIEMLQELGIPVEAERGRYGSYHLRPGYKLPPLFFTEDEAFALILGLLLARRFGLPSTAASVEGTLAKVERVLPAQVRTRLQSMEQALIVDSGAGHEISGEVPDSKVVMALSTAVKARQRVHLCYVSLKGEESERNFDPYAVAYYNSCWYTIGYCNLRHELRLFRMERILDVVLCEETFERPSDFNALEAIERVLASVPKQWQVEVRLEISLVEARRYFLLSKVLLEETENGVLFRCHVDDLTWMARFLAGLGIPLVVHHPPELRTLLRQHAQALMGYADRSDD